VAPSGSNDNDKQLLITSRVSASDTMAATAIDTTTVVDTTTSFETAIATAI
jgi:hypothetical protein